ncbi:hypothetical protein CFC21_021093 [Triticum aestivum]|uniref:Uncharacterized protein n=3 Tax=Triticum TaxID=4564 RepID=A0A9R1PCD5_TRITD|nr:hypothetical protein CFC21_021093 [Triticum aestivum]VAH40861.1 unnamed protein product [Triticum turgidum subsp. durum]
MAKRNTVGLLLVLAIMFSSNVLEGVAHQSQVVFSRKVINAEQKASFSGMSSSHGGHVSGATNAGGVSNNAEIENVETTTTIESHRDVSVGDFHGINHKPPTYNMP